MYILVNLNCAISIVLACIFEYNYEKVLGLTKESLDIISSPSIGEEQVAKFETVFYAVRYLWAPGNLKIG